MSKIEIMGQMASMRIQRATKQGAQQGSRCHRTDQLKMWGGELHPAGERREMAGRPK
jgi:hypothetical protein